MAINNATGPDRRGELNGISTSVSALAGAFSPMFFSALFAFSIQGDRPSPFNYHLVFYLLGLLRLAAAYMGWSIIDDTGGGEALDAETSTTGKSTLDEYIGADAKTSTAGESKLDEYIVTKDKSSTAGESKSDEYIGKYGKSSAAGEPTLDGYIGTE